MSYQKIKKQEIDVIQSMTVLPQCRERYLSFRGKSKCVVLIIGDWILNSCARLDRWIGSLGARIYRKIARGALNVTINVRDETKKMVNSNLDPHAIQLSLEAIQLVEDQAMELGVMLAPSKASDVLLRFLAMKKLSKATNTAALKSALMTDFTDMVDNFIEARRNEGDALKEVLLGQAAQITTLLKSTGLVLQTREINLKENFKTQLKILIGSAANVDPQRLAQELATIMIKFDVTEEVDRFRFT